MPVGSDSSEEDQSSSSIAELLARNLETLLNWAGTLRRFRDRAPLPELLANYIADQNWEEGTVSKRQIYRYLKAQQAAGIDSLALIARAFEMEAWELLVPDFHVGARHFVLTADEKQLFEDMKATARRFVIDEGRKQASRPGTSSVDTDSADSASVTPDAGKRDPSGRPAGRKRKTAKKTKTDH